MLRLTHVTTDEKALKMNRIELPKRNARKRIVREERPARLELTLELPRDHAPARDTPEVEKTERGIAVVDFFI